MSKIEKMKVIVDTREQEPLGFTDYAVSTVVDKLDAGDYSLVGADRPGSESIIFERKKNCAELIRNIGALWETFQKELAVLQQYEVRAILVGEPQVFHALYERGYTKLHPNFVYKRLAEIQVVYGVPTIFFPNRSHVEHYIFRAFSEMEKRLRA